MPKSEISWLISAHLIAYVVVYYKNSNLTLEKVVEKTQAMELVKKQALIMQQEEMQACIVWPKVTQVDFPSNAVFALGVQPILQISEL